MRYKRPDSNAKAARRRLLLEQLESRLLLVGEWQNPINRLDVNIDGQLSPFDALSGINEINIPTVLGDQGLLPDRRDHLDKPYWSTNGDEFLTSGDILLVINALNRRLPPVITAALQADTAAGGSTNDDHITSDSTILGTVTDESGVQALMAEIDSASPIDVAFDPFGNFSLNPQFLPGGLEDGQHTIRFTAVDFLQNAADPVEVSFTLDATPPALTVSSPLPDDTIHANSLVSISLDQSQQTNVSYRIGGGDPVSIPFDASMGRFESTIEVGSLPEGPHALSISATDQAGNVAAAQIPVDLARTRAGMFHVTDYTPQRGASEVGVTFRPQVVFSEAVDVATLTEDNLYASSSGEKIPARIIPANDGTFAWLYFTDAMPGATHVTVTVDGSSIRSQTGRALDANADGMPGGTLNYGFSTVSLAPLPGTTLTGLVVDPGPDLKPNTPDDFDAGPDGLPYTADDVYLLPIPGVEVHLVGLENQKVVTDAAGRFTLDPVPAGNVKVAIEGNTATAPPEGYYFPEMVMDANMSPLQVNTTMPHTEVLYLPRLDTSILQTISADAPTKIVTGAEGGPDLTPAERERLTIDIPADSFIGPDGLPLDSARIGISAVPPELVVDMLPPGIAEHTFDITIQAPGVELFSTPAPMSFPNVFGTPPGTKHNFLSFDHTTGRLSIEGTATVSEDGLAIVTDPGFGITHPGWHGPMDRRTETEPCPTTEHNREIAPSLTYGFLENSEDVAPLENKLFFNDGGELTLFFKNNADKLDPQTDECSLTNSKAIPLEVKITVDAFADNFLEGLETQELILLPKVEEKIEIRAKDLLGNVGRSEKDELFGTKVTIEISKQGDMEKLVEEELFFYRLLDVADTDHVDGTLEFADTANDGQGTKGARRIREFKLTMEPDVEPTLQLSADQNFKFDKTSGFTFDPQQTAQDLTSTVTVVPPAKPGQAPMSVGSFTLQGDGEVFGVNLNEDGFLATLEQLASGQLPGASAAERALIAGNEQAILDDVKARFRLLGASNLTAGPDDMLQTADDGGLSIGDGAGNPISVSAFSSADAQLDAPRLTTIGQASQIDVDGLSAVALILGFPGVNAAERGFRLSEMLNETPEGTVEVYIDRMFDLAEFTTTDTFVNAFTKTLLHEAGHEAGLVHTSTNFGGSILGFKFEDIAADGAYDFIFDPPLGGVEVALLDSSGVEVQRTETDNNGIYLFSGVLPGSYTVQESVESLNPPSSGSIIPGEHRFNWCPSTPTSYSVNVTAGEVTEAPDFGNYRKVPISGFKYEDQNGNGLRDAGEPPLEGWGMTLTDSQGNVVQSVSTNANGFFVFDEVDPGRYVIEEEDVLGWEASADSATSNGTGLTDANNAADIIDVDLLSGDVVKLEFLNYFLADVHGHKFDDNGDPIGGVTIVLHKPDGTTEQTVTDPTTGSYAFTDLRPGVYTISEVVPAGFVLVFPMSGQHTVDHTKGSLNAVNFLETPFNFINAPLGLQDFGDSPDPAYPTLAASAGAAHSVDPTFHLGALIDPDPDGQPDSTATGDDNDSQDDEDGVAFTSPLTPGQTASVTVTASAAGQLDAFIDFNGDADWDDPGEKVFDNTSLVGGANSLTFAVPPGAIPGTSFARFRLSSIGGLSASGTAPDGEVEDYRVEIAAVDMDYGDAPDPSYPTLLIQDGARHLVQPGLSLGATVDVESDGQPNVDSTGDDAGTADEDGVTFVTALVPGSEAIVRVTATGTGMLDAFIDFNADGDWNGGGEQVFASRPLLEGPNDLVFSVPLETPPEAELVARFRFSSAGGLGPTGAASDGEVEDHQIQVASVELDYGDAPDPEYPTLTASDGGRHILGGGLFLGTGVDADADGQSDASAAGDDDGGQDDEDGIEFVDLLLPGATARIAATASAAGFLDAWLDANVDGDWDDRGEQILVRVPLVAGENLIEFEVPGTTRPGLPTFARFRFSSKGDLRPTGLAADGEVEDYLVELLPIIRRPADEVDADPIAIANAAAYRDIMAQGLDVAGLLRFELSDAALKIALGLNWSDDTVNQALSYYGDYLLASLASGGFFDDIIQPGNPVPATNGAALHVRSESTGLLVSEFDFGPVLVDGADGAFAEETFSLRNIGDQPLTISETVFAAQNGLTLIAPAEGTVLDPLETTTLVVAFDPHDSGRLESSVQIQHDGIGAPFDLHLSGFAQSIDGDIRADVALNNLGGVKVGTGPHLFEGYATLRNIGADRLRVADISPAGVGVGQYAAHLPAGVTTPFELEPGGAVQLDVTFEPTAGGLQRGGIDVTSDDPETPVLSIPIVGTGLTGETGVIGNDYVVFEAPDTPGTPILRIRSDDTGNYSFSLRPETSIHYLVFDPDSGLIHESYGVTAAASEATLLPQLVFGPDTSPDTDGDGLPDDTEFAIGTRKDKVDTNGDGVSDFAAVLQGLDPLVGFSAITGQVGVLPLANPAVEIEIAASPQDPSRILAYLATEGNGGGLTIADVTDASVPIVLANLPLTGAPNDIAIDTVNNLAVLSGFFTGTNGARSEMMVVDISDPTAPELLRSVEGVFGFNIEVFDGIAYLFEGSSLHSVDLATGQTLDTRPRGFDERNSDTVREGNFLYVMRSLFSTPVVQIFELATDGSGRMIERGSVEVPGANGKMSVHDGRIYAVLVEAGGGVATVDVSDPDAPRLLAGVDTATRMPVQDIAASASDLVYTVGRSPAAPSTFSMAVLDLSDPTNNASAFATFAVEDEPRAVAVGGGRAYLATVSGIRIYNFPSFDIQNQPPTVTLSTPRDDDPTREGIQVIEGEVLPLFAPGTSDDVQLRSVELLVDGQVETRDFSTPFDLSVNMPLIADAGSLITFQARATDTGGNLGSSEVLTVELIPDNRPPSIIRSDPIDGGFRPAGSVNVHLEFSEELAANSRSEQFFTLRDAGDILVAADSAAFTSNSVTLRFPALTDGEYELSVDAANVTDTTGNSLAGDSVTSFTVGSGDIFWINPEGGDWNEPQNWSTGSVPSATDEVVIGVDGEITINLTGGTANRLFSEERLVGVITLEGDSMLSGGIESLNGSDSAPLTFNGLVTLDGESSLLAEIRGEGSITNRGTLSFRQGENDNAEGRVDLAINNEGRILHDFAFIDLGEDGVINNLAGGSYELRHSSVLSGTINNSGELKKTGVFGAAIGTLNSTGQLIDVRSGELEVESGSHTDTTIHLGSQATVRLLRGDHTFAGDTSVEGGGTFRMERGTATIPAGSNADFTLGASALEIGLGSNTFDLFVDGTLTSRGHTSWRSADIVVGESGEFISEGHLDIEISATRRLIGQLTNRGMVAHLGSTVILDNATIVNDENAEWHVLGIPLLDDLATTSSEFRNEGLLRKAVDTSATLDVPITGGGRIVVEAGRLGLARGGQYTDLVATVDTDAALELSGGEHRLLGASTLNGDGLVEITRGTLVVSAGSNLDSELAGAGLTVKPSAAADGLIVEGTAVNHGSLALQRGQIEANGQLNNASELSWTGGSIAGTGFENTGLITIPASAFPTLRGVLTNHGRIDHATHGNLNFANAMLQNEAGAEIHLRSTGGFAFGFGSTTHDFNNEGSLIKEGEGLSTLAVNANNSGLFDVRQGELALSRGGANVDATYAISDSATVRISGGNHSFAGNTSAMGEGSFIVSSGTTVVEPGGMATFDMVGNTFEMLGGVLTVDGVATSAGAGLWTSGTINGDGEFRNTGVFEIGGAGSKNLQVDFRNESVVQHTTTRLVSVRSAAITNAAGATYELSGAAGFGPGFGSNSHSFANTGIFTRSGGDSAVTIDIGFTTSGDVELQSGTTVFADGYVQTGGSTLLTGGDLSVNALTVDLQGGRLSGSGTITGSVLNAGTIDVGAADSAGKLTLTRDFEQTSTGVLNIEIGGAASGEFDELVTNANPGIQAALFDGTLNVTVLGGVTLSANDSLGIITYDAGFSGDFATTNGLDIGGGLVLQKQFTATALTLTAVPALHLERELGSPAVAKPITRELVQPVLLAAVDRWAAKGLPANVAAVLRQTEIVILDLPGTVLAAAVGNRILVDRDAAGTGWFVDLTPGDDAEFKWQDGILRATDGSARQVDLLTVLAHELAHLLGADHRRGFEETLMPGVRQDVAALAVDAFFEAMGLGKD